MEYSEKGAGATERVQIPDQLAPLAGEEPGATNGSRAPLRPTDLLDCLRIIFVRDQHPRFVDGCLVLRSVLRYPNIDSTKFTRTHTVLMSSNSASLT